MTENTRKLINAALSQLTYAHERATQGLPNADVAWARGVKMLNATKRALNSLQMPTSELKPGMLIRTWDGDFKITEVFCMDDGEAAVDGLALDLDGQVGDYKATFWYSPGDPAEVLRYAG